MSNSVQPLRQQPTRLPRPWDSPGKNTGVGCHFLLQCMKVKREREVAQSCPILSNCMDCSLPGSSIHGSFQARVPEWGYHCLFHYLTGRISNHNRLIVSSFENFLLFLKFTKEVFVLLIQIIIIFSDLFIIQKSLETGW